MESSRFSFFPAFRAAAGCVALCLVAAGCGDSSLVKVKGRVTVDGQALQLAPGEQLEVTFFPVAEKNSPSGDILPALVERDGSFRVVGALKRGIPRGNYHVGIEVVNAKKNSPVRAALRATKTPITREITGKEEIVIDLTKPPG